MGKESSRNAEGLDKSPYLRGAEKKAEKAFQSVEKSVKPVARDTNKTRRAATKARKVGVSVKKELPVSNPNKKITKSKA